MNFKGEDSIDDGGPSRELFDFICSDITSEFVPLLIPTENNRTNHGEYRECFQVNSRLFGEENFQRFKFLGAVLGYAVRVLSLIHI